MTAKGDKRLRSDRLRPLADGVPLVLTPRRDACYTQRGPVPVPSPKEFAAMTEAEPEEVREKKGGKRKLLRITPESVDDDVHRDPSFERPTRSP